ncbi:pectate lyase [Ruminiclostridium herbifermentans]|uniref:Probable pectate lyase C n=1 Tax=Ruminiclostridium herbifermentans TaxID=2488810 RepID=A0A4U7JHA2_9FIRM|nr:pectate lyase [Ruminiclostridium herbifermentans]QNU66057.1 pectate lyase [Ruminiclostridium herbifermentans]
MLRDGRKSALNLLGAIMLVFIFSSVVLAPKGVFASTPDWGSVLKNPDTWFGSSDGIKLADSIVQYQLSDGGWRKDMTESTSGSWGKSTIDNDTTTSQIIVLAKTYKQTNNSKYLNSCQRGIDLLLNGQYSNGGWPQVFNDPGTYHAHITYNDNAMIHVMNLLTDVANKTGDFTFIDSNRASRASTAIQKGIQCILNTQITVNGVKTAWCQQHDEYSLKPTTGRAYEVPSISASESVGIVNYLKTIKNPSAEITNAINSAIAWMAKVQIYGIKVVTTSNDRYIVNDPTAGPIWARFYEINTNRPIFVDRDGSIHYQMSEISQERRAGYAWYGTWPSKLVKEANIYDIVVAKDGTGNYTTVQAAINSVPNNSAKRTTIYIKNGTYKEKMNIGSSKINITLIGQSKEGTILTYNDAASTPNSSGGTLGTTGSASITVAGSGFQAENITFENSYDEARNGSSQAVAMLAKADKMIFKNCSFKGNQDTLYANSGRQYYYNCYIEGDVDFIFGAATAVFYNCEVYSLNRSGGCVTAPSTKADQKGYLFYKCKLTSSSATPKNISLGRPWIPSSDPNSITPKVLFRECELGNHISSAGWTSMSGNNPENYEMWEYLNTGAGSNPNRKQLPSSRASEYTMEKFLAGTDGWDPNITEEIEQPILEGKYIKSLVVNDSPNAADWSVQSNLRVGDLVYGDRTVKFISMPDYLLGSEWIRTACDSKMFTTTEATFTPSTDIICYIGLDTRITSIPSWFSSWTNTGETFDNDGAVTFRIYKKSFPRGATVELGTNGASSSVVNYVVIVQPQPISEGEYIKSLLVNDSTNAADWSIQSNLQVGDLVFGDRTVKFISMPDFLIGSEWIRTACDSKMFTSTEATFVPNIPITCYVGLDTRITSIPSWLSGWTNIGETFDNDGAVTFQIYMKSFPGGTIVELGTNGASSSVVNYVVIVKPDYPPMIIPGDVVPDGQIDALDFAYIKKHLLGIELLTGDSYKAADIDNSGTVDAIDLALLKKALLEGIH